VRITDRLKKPVDNSRYNAYLHSVPGNRSLARTAQALACLEDQVFFGLLRTADALLRDVERTLKPQELSHTQYNVLRILRGAGPGGLACREIGERMLTRDPDITRLLDRLEARGLVTRERQAKDRRVVKTRITPAGLRLLAALDEPIRTLHRRQMRHLSPARLRVLLELLEEVREKETGEAGR